MLVRIQYALRTQTIAVEKRARERYNYLFADKRQIQIETT